MAYCAHFSSLFPEVVLVVNESEEVPVDDPQSEKDVNGKSVSSLALDKICCEGEK